MATSETDQRTRSTLNDYDSYNDDYEEDDSNAMSLVDHLEELRWRIFKSLIAIAVGSIIAFIFREQITALLEVPLPVQANVLGKGGSKLVVNGLTEGFTVYLLISFVGGFIMALPVVLYQTWAFIAPGLYQREKKYAVPFIVVGVLLFCAGVTLAYFVLRYPVEWLVTFGEKSFTELVTADSYFKFVAFFMLIFGLVFELPLVLTFLAKVGLVGVATLRKKRSAAHIGMWIASTVVTPGADLYSPIIIGVAMSVLYELSILFIHFTIKEEVEVE